MLPPKISSTLPVRYSFFISTSAYNSDIYTTDKQRLKFDEVVRAVDLIFSSKSVNAHALLTSSDLASSTSLFCV
jgi:hypothetical protein